MHAINNKLPGIQLEKCIVTDRTLYLEEVWKPKQDLTEKKRHIKKFQVFNCFRYAENYSKSKFIFNLEILLLVFFFLKITGNKKK